MELTKTILKQMVREEIQKLNEDDYATQYVDVLDDITKEINRKSSKIVKILLKGDRLNNTKNARLYNQIVDTYFKNFIAAAQKITAKIED